MSTDAEDWDTLLLRMAEQHSRAEPITYPPGVVAFETAVKAPVDMTLRDGPIRVCGRLSYTLTATLEDGTKISTTRTIP